MNIHLYTLLFCITRYTQKYTFSKLKAIEKIPATDESQAAAQQQVQVRSRSRSRQQLCLFSSSPTHQSITAPVEQEHARSL